MGLYILFGFSLALVLFFIVAGVIGMFMLIKLKKQVLIESQENSNNFDDLHRRIEDAYNNTVGYVDEVKQETFSYIDSRIDKKLK